MQVTSEGRPGRGNGPRNSRRTLARLYRYMIEWRGMFYGMVALLLVSLVCELAMPLVIESAINAISVTGGVSVDMKALTVSIGLLAFVALVSSLAGWAQERVSAQISLNMSRRLRQDVLKNLLEVSVSSFEGRRRGDVMSRVTNDAEVAAGAFSETIKELISCMIVVIGCAAIMFLKCAPMAAVAVGAALVSVFVSGMLSRLVYPAYVAQQASLGKLNAHVEESLKAFKTCKAAGRAGENDRRMTALSREYYACRLRANRLEFMMGPVMLLLGNLNFLITVVFGANRIIAGAITVGTMQAFILYSKQFMEPLSSLGEYFVRSQNALASAERVFDIMDAPKEAREVAEAAAGAPEAVGRAGELRFENVSFAYHKNLPILKNLNLTLQKGERLALVGRTGAGKTTLTNLLLLFYPGYGGGITYDGRDIRGEELSALREKITVISQEPQIVAGTVLENMLYGAGGATRQDAEAAMERMGISDMIARLPNGLDTAMGSIGDNLSQGQLQLICMVRALLRKSEILILDEATSSLDPDTERMVKRGMEAAMEGRTTLIIAHRLSSVMDADHIAVLADGRIAEYGDHETLMARNGAYHALYHTQYLGREI